MEKQYEKKDKKKKLDEMRLNKNQLMNNQLPKVEEEDDYSPDRISDKESW